jgi:hypothetical protein
MRIPKRLVRLLNQVLVGLDLQLLPGEALQRLTGFRSVADMTPQRPSQPPPEAADYLRWDNSRLVELQRRYSKFKRRVGPDTQWSEDYVRTNVELSRFRCDNAYVYQLRDWNSAASYALTAYYLKTRDRLSLMTKLEEDDLFGAHVFDLNGECLISRDLLDSISEIYFLHESVGMSDQPQFTMLDIGAGYGRLAHRVSAAFPGCVQVLLTDAVATSTFLSEFYVRFRNCKSHVRVVPLDEVEGVLDRTHVDLATNIHSFSECPSTWVCWWLDLLRKHSVRYLIVVPNEGLTTEEAGKKPADFRKEIELRGYRLIKERPKYEAPIVQSYGVSPTNYFLFELGDVP